MVIISYFTKTKRSEFNYRINIGSASAAQRAETRASYNYWDVINSAIIITIITCLLCLFLVKITGKKMKNSCLLGTAIFFIKKYI
jgi:hypothetical protein